MHPHGDISSIQDGAPEELHRTELEESQAIGKLNESEFPSDISKDWTTDHLKRQYPSDLNPMHCLGRNEADLQGKFHDGTHPENKDMCVDMELSD